jgi:PhzF family phenazine biosynthesis protein
MIFPFYWIDAFTDRAFAGNPAGVMPLAAWPDDALMQHMAFEHGLSETAFFVPAKPPPAASAKVGRYQLRWFTPAVEVDLCGHATLAAAHVLFNELGARGDVVTFDTRSGALTAARRPDAKIQLDFPATPAQVVDDAIRAREVSHALGGAEVAWLGRSQFDWFAQLRDAAAVRAVRPDFPRIAALGARGLIVTAAGDDCDFVSRFFAPQSGVAEDPVTGSAHSALAPFWAARLGQATLHARQVSARGGELWCEVAGDRVKIAGHSRRYLRGEVSA